MMLMILYASLTAVFASVVLFADELGSASTLVQIVAAGASVIMAFLTARENRMATEAKLKFDTERALEKQQLTYVTAKVKECDDEKAELRKKDEEQQEEIDQLRGELDEHKKRCPTK